MVTRTISIGTGSTTGDTYQEYLYATIDVVAEHDWMWSVCSHDHGTPTPEAFHEMKGKWLREFIPRAQDRGLRFLSPPTVYDELRSQADGAAA